MKDSRSDPVLAEKNAAEITDLARIVIEWVNSGGPGQVGLYDQASANIRNYMADRGVDVRDPVFVVGWAEALRMVQFMLSSGEDLENALMLTLAAGLMGRVNDGDSGSGT